MTSSVQVVLANLNTGGRVGGVVISHNGLSNYLAAVMIDGSPDRVEVRLYNLGLPTVLSTFTPAFGATNTLRLSRNGSTLNVTLNGTVAGGVTLTTTQLLLLGSGTLSGTLRGEQRRAVRRFHGHGAMKHGFLDPGKTRQLARRLVALVLVAACLYCVWPTRLGGRTAMIVVEGNSMEPTYSQGDLIVARSQGHYRSGDIVVFPLGTVGDGQRSPLVIHRILAEDSAGFFTTQGDNRAVADGFRVTSDAIVGRALGACPGGRIGTAHPLPVVDPRDDHGTHHRPVAVATAGSKGKRRRFSTWSLATQHGGARPETAPLDRWTHDQVRGEILGVVLRWPRRRAAASTTVALA